MSKSVLVIDTPRTCMRCPFGLIIGDYFFCVITIYKDGLLGKLEMIYMGLKNKIGVH